MSIGKPPLPVVWCDFFTRDSPIYWENFLQINMKMNFYRKMLFKWTDFT